jgi:uncharacterized protein (TIGR03067 family)
MRPKLLVLLAVGLLAAADAPTKDADKKDKLAGTWTVASGQRDGMDLDGIKGDTVQFDGATMTVKTQNGDHRATFKVDATKKPKAIDLTPEDGPEKGQTIAGIYAFDGDDLKLCFARPGKGRPTAFVTKAGSDLMLIVLRPEKP